MSKESDIDQDESAFFRREMEGVQRLRHDRVVHSHSRSAPKPRYVPVRTDGAGERDFLSDEYGANRVAVGDMLDFSRPGVQRSVLRKLRRGKLPVGAELDLHGYIQTAARVELSGFLHLCIERDIRCVKIIHGKGRGSRQGQPVLKGRVDSWLRQYSRVLAFCSARPEDGGTGAVYVLLKGSGRQV